MAEINKWRLFEYLQKAGYNQASLAKEIGMSVTNLNNKINGRSSIEVKQVRDICNALNIVDEKDIVEIFIK